MIRSLTCILAISTPAAAETARVYSGEHDGFTRLVVELPAEIEWSVGRTSTGYAFATRPGEQPDYDISGVWNRISRTRVSALEVDPKTGALLVSLGCDCHLFPFEFRPSAIVLDIKQGPPPAGSVFELPIEENPSRLDAGDPAGELTPPVSYNWLSDLPTVSVRSLPSLPLPMATGEVSLDGLRNTLLEQIARGAADGIVDIGQIMPSQAVEGSEQEELPWSRVMLGEHPGVRVSDPDAFIPGSEPTGRCPEVELLDIAAWGGGGSPLDLLAAARSGLYGEFDIAEPEAVLKSVRSHIYLGFGAEAAQIVDLAMASDESDLPALYGSMARTVDGDTDPGTPFATMLDCDGPAALWAALARDRLPPGEEVNRAAVLRSFLALPPHLRAHLGSGLAEKFLVLDDPDAARTIRDAMERAPNIDAASIALLDTERALHQGDLDAASTYAEAAVSLEGNGAEGLVALVEAHFRKLSPVGPEVAEALISGRGEASGTEMAGKIDRAIVLALALSGQADAAFGHESAADETLVDLWSVVQAVATDDEFLRHAVLPAGLSAPDISRDLSLAISRRLLSLGFPDAASTWVGSTHPDDAPDRRLVAAEAALDLGDARLAVNVLEGLPGAEAANIRAQALLQLGDLTAAEEAFAASGQTDAASRTNLWEGEWSTVGATTPDLWRAAAEMTRPVEPDAASGLLDRGGLAVEASVTARETIDALLSTVAGPDGN